ncbi:MAG: hypothetical protein IPM37_08595 [Hahellaceae bacterium]|nr:hypothetical protein [Hahellaceae bacterium]
MAQPTQSKSLLWFLLVGLVALVAVDPGLLNGWHSIRYDLAEGQSITGRLLVLCLSSLIVLLPLLVSSHVVVILYLILLFVMTSIGLSFRLINGQFSLWEASIVLNELDFAGDAISAFSGIILKAIALSALLVAVLFWFRPRRIRSTPGTAAMFAPMILPVAYLLFARGGSAQSNLLLRTGARPDQLPDENGELFAMPNLYQYAKKAGYRPYYLDAQVKGHRLQNFYTQQEMGFLQEYVPLKNHIELPEYNYDLRLADEITKRVADSHENVFIWANKVGTHFPYPKTYPDSDKYPDADKAEHYRHAIH